jgi:hypothetical protein
MNKMTAKEYRESQMKGYYPFYYDGKKPSKMHNIKTEVDGHRFDSKKEAKRYGELKLLEKAGKIRDLKIKTRYLLQEGFRYQGHKIQDIEYEDDFSYYDPEIDRIVIEDTKPSTKFKTDVYKIKKKLFLYKFIEPQQDLYVFKEVY